MEQVKVVIHPTSLLSCVSKGEFVSGKVSKIDPRKLEIEVTDDVGLVKVMSLESVESLQLPEGYELLPINQYCQNGEGSLFKFHEVFRGGRLFPVIRCDIVPRLVHASYNNEPSEIDVPTVVARGSASAFYVENDEDLHRAVAIAHFVINV